MKTTRCLMATLLGLLFVPGVAAQKPAPAFGVLGGVNFATFKGDDVEDVSSRTGFMAGVFGEFALSRSLFLEPEVLYTQKGATETFEGMDFALKLTYVEVPLLLKMKFGTEDAKVRPHVYLGPAISFKTSCKLGVSEGGVDVDADCDDPDWEQELEGTDFSGVVGAGLDFGNFRAGVRYIMGFTDLEASSSVKNSVFSLYVGYAFARK